MAIAPALTFIRHTLPLTLLVTAAAAWLAGCCCSSLLGGLADNEDGRTSFIDSFNDSQTEDCQLEGDGGTTVTWNCPVQSIGILEAQVEGACAGYDLVGFKKVKIKAKDSASVCDISDCTCHESQEDYEARTESKKKKKKSKKSKKSKKKSKTSKSKTTKKESASGGGSLASLDASRIEKVIKAEGWKIVTEPIVTKNDSADTTTFTIMKLPLSGAVVLYDYKNATIAKTAAEAMKKQSAVRRDGGMILMVTIPQDKGEAEKLAAKLAGD